MPTQAQALVKGFVGENRLLPDDLLADNIAVDGLNVDYSRATIKKRRGMTKTHKKAVLAGGLEITNAANNKCVIIRDQTAMDLAGTFTFECIIEPLTNPEDWTATCLLVSKFASADGWFLWYQVSGGVWRFRKYDGGGVSREISFTGDVTANTPRAGEKYHIAVWRTSGNSMTGQITRFRDGVSVAGSSVTVSGDTNNTRDVYVGAGNGATPANLTQSFRIDELRMWASQRTTTEINDAKYRELNAEEAANTNLIGYWKFNDKGGNIVQDLSANRNHGNLYQSGPSYVTGLVPNASEDNYAIRGDGYDDYVACGYSSAYSTILSSDDEWTIEFWARLDASIAPGATQTLISFGNYTAGGGSNGSLLTVEMTTGGLLQYRYSTSAAASNTLRTLTTPYYFQPGVPVHIAIQRYRSTGIRTFINGEAYDDYTSFTGAAENGPGTSSTYGMNFFAKNSAGTLSEFGQFTLDEVRVWKVIRNRVEIQYWMNRELPDAANANLVGYWRFNAADLQKDETGNVSNFTESPSDDKPSFSCGLAYPRFPSQVIKLIAPIAKPIRTDELNTGRVLYDREILTATRDSFWSQAGTEVQPIAAQDNPGSDNLYAYTHHNGHVVVCNGAGRNYVYNGITKPASLTLPTWTDNLTVSAGAGSATFAVTGEYKYRFAWYNEDNGVEGLATGIGANVLENYEKATITATTQQITISGVPSSLSGYPSVTHWRVYRCAPGSTLFYLVATVAIGTTSYIDTGTQASLVSVETNRSHLNPANFCEVHNNRLFMARDSLVFFSQPDSFDFGATNFIQVDVEDGDAVTGLKSAFGVLLITKKNSLHILDGDGPSTFQLRKVVDGAGCVSHHTIAASPSGVYFLGSDGVYRFNGQSTQYISYPNQSLFNKIDHERAHLAVGVYHPDTHQYIVSLDLATEALALDDAESDAAKPAASAYDDTTLRSLFTHYYKCDATGVDSMGSGGTINDADIVFNTTDADRNIVAKSNAEWTTSITAQTAVASDFTIGFWRKFPQVNTASSSLSEATWLKIGSGTGVINGITFESDVPGGIFLYRSNATLRVSLNASSGAGTQIANVTVPATAWFHVVLKKSGTTYTLYINGEPVVTTGLSDPNAVFSLLGAAETAGIGGDAIEPVFLDNIFWVRNVALTTAQIAAIYDYERFGPAVSLTTDSEPDGDDNSVSGITMVLDEETEAWARHDKRFSYLALAEHTSRTNEVLAALNGFVVRLLEGSSDAALIDGVTGVEYTKSGALAAATGFKITDAAATFPVVGNGYAGCEFVAVPTDTSLEEQRRIILYNDATNLLLDSALTDTVTGTYYIGPIKMLWESRWMDLGNPTAVKRIYQFMAWVKEAAGGAITFDYKTDQSETYTTVSLATDDELVRTITNTRGRKIKIRFRHMSTTATAELESFQLLMSTRGLN